jgi:3'(2'), 5'-bisphosphate nucleotidase
VLDLPSRTMQMWATPSGAGISEGGHERSLTAMAGVRNVMAASSSERNRPHLERVRAALPEFAWLPANSVGFKAAQVLLGEADLFVHPRSIAEWDACAPAAVIAGAGAQATDLAGQPLRYNTASGKVPGLIFSRRDDHQRIVSRLAAAGIVLP